jgi:parallel beta-helix repeat protein
LAIYPQRIDENIYGNTYSGNTKNYIEVQDGTIQENKTYTWKKDGAPYVAAHSISVQLYNNNAQHLSTLEIESGTTVMFKSGVDLYIGHESNSNYKGALIANGVTFTAYDSTGWNGIRFRGYADDSNCLIDSSIVEGAVDGIYCQSASPTITNSTIRNNTDGIFADSGSQPTITGNRFTGNGRPLAIYPQRIDENIYGNTYSGNTKNYIEVQDGTIQENKTYTWKKDGAPYVAAHSISVQLYNNNAQHLSTLEIESGTTVMFKSGVDLYIGHENSGDYKGALIANGVTFTAYDSTGWNGIRFRNYADDNNCLIDSSIVEGAVDGIYCQSNNCCHLHNYGT